MFIFNIIACKIKIENKIYNILLSLRYNSTNSEIKINQTRDDDGQ
jgi:hypothetical protein